MVRQEDVAGGKVSELGGFRAVGTTSAGIASTLGFADGERMEPDGKPSGGTYARLHSGDSRVT